MPKFAGSISEIDENTPFVEKLAYVLMEMADCDETPRNLNDPVLERLFHAADTQTMDDYMKGNYMKSIIGERDYESGLEDAREEGLEMGIEQGLEQGLQQGIEQGLEQGLQQGIEQGRIEERSERDFFWFSILREKGFTDEQITEMVKAKGAEQQEANVR